MTDMAELERTSSKESELDRLLEELIAKIVARVATAEDMAHYQELLASRTRMMRPPSLRSRSGEHLRRRYA